MSPRADFSKIQDPYLKYSLKLQETFGLRREESIKFNAYLADKGEYIHLKGSRTKGNVERKVPILTAEQRNLINGIPSIIPSIQYN